jgi:hypothetical protein
LDEVTRVKVNGPKGWFLVAAKAQVEKIRGAVAKNEMVVFHRFSDHL